MFILRVIAISLFLYTPSTIVSFIMGKYWNGVHHFITIVILELFALGHSAFNRSYSDTLGNKLFELALLFLTSKFRPSLKTDLSSLLNRRLLSRRLVARFLQLCSVISYRILPIISSFLFNTTTRTKGIRNKRTNKRIALHPCRCRDISIWIVRFPFFHERSSHEGRDRS